MPTPTPDEEADYEAVQAIGQIVEQQESVDAIVEDVLVVLHRHVTDDAVLALVVVEMVRAHLLDSTRRAAEASGDDPDETLDFLARVERISREATERSLALQRAEDSGLQVTEGGQG